LTRIIERCVGLARCGGRGPRGVGFGRIVAGVARGDAHSPADAREVM
jgi:hypothetical protein